MHAKWWWATVLLCAAGATRAGNDFVAADGFEDQPESPDLAGITAQMNAVRREVVTAPALPPFTHDQLLQATAAAWAAQCIDVAAPLGIIDSNPDRSIGYPYFVGENIAATASAPLSIAAAVSAWAAEGENFDYGTNTCLVGSCANYTQLVWRTTLLVGCARSDCPAHTFRYAVICNFGPTGNTGGLPY